MSVSLEERQKVHGQLCQWIKDDPRRLAVFADLVLAILLGRSLQSPDLAENIIRDVQDQSIAQMLRRFYMNEAITWETHYAPVLAENPHPFENPTLGTGNTFGLFVLRTGFLCGR